MSYIGLDVGTSGCKAAVISQAGVILYAASAEYSFESPHPGYVELNPKTVWYAVKSILHQIAPYATDAKTIAVSSIGESMVILDKNDIPLYNGITYLDQRCIHTLPIIENRIPAKKLHKITGVSVNQMFTLNKFLWFRKYAPWVLENAHKYFLFGDYITYMLSGARAIDPSSASRTMFFNARNLTWSTEIANLFNIPIDKFSKVTPPGTSLGTIQATLAEEVGLPKNLLVIMGIHDQCAATLGSGALAPGDVMLGQGSTESINCVIHKNQLNPLMIENQICFEPYIDNNHYIVITGNLTHGSSMKWFLHNFYAKEDSEKFDYDKIYKNCPSTAGNVYFLPYLSKVNLMDPKNLALGSFVGIDVTVTKEQMYRALLEGLCYETRVSMEIFDKLQIPLQQLRASGGVSKSELYMQMKADVIGRSIEILKNPEAGVMGLAIISASACGDFKNCSEAASAFIACQNSYTPQRDYSAQYKNYQIISTAVKELYNVLETIRS